MLVFISCVSQYRRQNRKRVLSIGFVVTSLVLALLCYTWGLEGIHHIQPALLYKHLSFGYGEAEIPLSVCSNSARLDHLRDGCSLRSNGGLRTSYGMRNTFAHVISDDENQILFCVPPKAGSSTFKTLWLNYTRDIDGGTNIHNASFLRKHNLRSLDSYNTFGIRTRLNTYFKFMVARHPLLRVLSAYRQKFEMPNAYFHPVFGRYIEKKYGHIPANESKGDTVTFELFVHYLANTKPANYEHHWQPISMLCNPCQISYDYIAKLETSSDDWIRIFSQLKKVTDSKSNVLDDMANQKAVTDFDLVNEYYERIPAEDMTIFKTNYKLDMQLFGYTWNSTSMSRGCRIKTKEKECC